MKNSYKLYIFAILLCIIITLDIFNLGNILTITSSNKSDPKEKSSLLEDVQLINYVYQDLDKRKNLTLDKFTDINSSTTTTQITPKFTMIIYNASGVNGLGGKIKNDLEKLNIFEDISLENAESTNSSEIRFKENLNSQYKNLVLEIVQKDISSFTQSALPAQDPIDLLLIIGTGQ